MTRSTLYNDRQTHQQHLECHYRLSRGQFGQHRERRQLCDTRQTLVIPEVG